MNYYDEEISIGSGIGGEVRPPNNVKVERISSRGSNSDRANTLENSRSGAAMASARHGSGNGGADNVFQKRGSIMGRPRQRMAMHGNSTDDDGLLQDILDHDDEDEDGDDDDGEDSDLPMDSKPTIKPIEPVTQQQDFVRRSSRQRAQPRPSSSRMKMSLPTAKVMDNDSEASDTDSEDVAAGGNRSKGDYEPNWEAQLTITPEKWESLAINQEVKDLFPYILKYIPQHIETAYHLQPFIPDYVPAVGDVDAFLKVTEPTLLNPQRSREVSEHLQKLGLYFLDEPSGTQSEPSLLNMKLRSALTGSGKNARSASAALVPTAKSNKDIDKWINEVEQVHMSQSVFDVQPRKDIENMIMDWPRLYADATGAIQDAYKRSSQADQLPLNDYIRTLCQQFAIEGPLETQADYLLSVQTLFALYLAANQAWE